MKSKDSIQKMVIFVQKRCLWTYDFVLNFYLYWPIGDYSILKNLLGILQTTTFDSLRKFWKSQTPKIFKNSFPS